MTDEEKVKNMASQLRKPEGEDGLKTAGLMNKANMQIISDTFKALNAQGDDNILEIGMGDGFYVKDLLGKSGHIKYTGCDYSELMIQQSTKLNADSISKGMARFFHANISSLPFPDNEFNKVFTINTIYFWDNEITALNEVKRVLKPGGHFIIGFRPIDQMEKYPFTKYGFDLFSKSDVEKLLINNGFAILDAFENQESDFDMNGQAISRKNVVVLASK